MNPCTAKNKLLCLVGHLLTCQLFVIRLGEARVCARLKSGMIYKSCLLFTTDFLAHKLQVELVQQGETSDKSKASLSLSGRPARRETTEANKFDGLRAL